MREKARARVTGREGREGNYDEGEKETPSASLPVPPPPPLPSCLPVGPDDKRFKRRREIRFLVSGSQPARICHAPANLPSTSSILGHLGSTGNYNIGLLDEEFEVAAEMWGGFLAR